jgi:choline-glycine betaine transporter
MNKEQRVFWAAALQVLATGQFAYFGLAHLDKLVHLQGLPGSLVGVLLHGVLFMALMVAGHFVLKDAGSNPPRT